MSTIIKPGPIRYETDLGPLFLDRLLGEPEIDAIVLQMARQKLTPFDIVGAEIINGEIYFQLREPLSSD